MPDRPQRLRIDTGSVWEPLAGYSRAVRIGDRILVSGTTATHGAGEIICPGDVRSQAVYILDKIAASIEALGGALEDVVRTRIYIRDQSQWEAVSRVTWPLSRPCAAGEHAGGGVGPDRRLRRGDRGGSGDRIM